jgi:hypothetical protein
VAEFKDIAEFEDVVVVHATDKALLCRGLLEQDTWVPQSQIDDASEVYKAGDEGTLIVSEWWAKQAGLV